MNVDQMLDAREKRRLKADAKVIERWEREDRWERMVAAPVEWCVSPEHGAITAYRSKAEAELYVLSLIKDGIGFRFYKNHG